MSTTPFIDRQSIMMIRICQESYDSGPGVALGISVSYAHGTMVCPCVHLIPSNWILNVDDLDAYHADFIPKQMLHIFKAVRVTDERWAHPSLPHNLSAMSARLDDTSVWIAFDNPYVLMICFVIDMVQLSSAWLSQQRTFFICLYPLVVTLIDL